MTTTVAIGKLLLLVIILNLVRYVIGGPIEQVTIMEPMHRVMPLYPDVFNADFSRSDFYISLFYNFMLWVAVTLQFHLMAPALRGNLLVRSAISYAISLLLFISLAAIYMNHFDEVVRDFFRYSMLDAVILFIILAVTNAVVYPRLFPGRLDR